MTKYEIYEYSGTADYDVADRDYEYLADKFGEVGKSHFIAAFDSLDEAKAEIESLHLQIVVSDTGYVKNLPPDCILEQTPANGTKVKSGHIIYVIINSASTPTLAIPDVIDNSSLREAEAKLTAMGFKLAATEYISGEKSPRCLLFHIQEGL
jgi:hypothetical protein